MSVEIKEVQYENYGKCLSMRNDVLEVIVTIDVGPRIIHFSHIDEQNILYNDLARKADMQGELFDEFYGIGSKFCMYGGHRVWLSPERIPETYYPDNEPVVYSVLPDGVIFTPPRQKTKDVQLSFQIMMNAGASDIMVVHNAQNCAKDKLLMSLWAITAVAPGGVLLLPQNKTDTEPLANRSLSFWPNSNIQDSRFFLGNEFITLRQTPAIQERFKFGTNNHNGWCAYINNGCTFVKRYVHTRDVRYPDYGCSFEADVNGDCMQVETLSPLYNVEPKEIIRHVENWSVFKGSDYPNATDEEQIRKFAEMNLGI